MTSRAPHLWLATMRRSLSQYIALALTILVLVGIFSVPSQHFFSAATFQTIANQVPSALLAATGMTFVLILGGIDLSVGSILGLCSATLGVLLVQHNWPVFPACAVAFGIGAAAGMLNGSIAVAWRLPTFIVTLGMLEMARGGAHLITRSQTQYIGSKIEALAAAQFGGLSIAFYAAIFIAILAQLILTRTVFGRYVVAIGTNEEAVRLSGIDPRPVKIAVFGLSGALVALGAIVDTSRFLSANPNAGTGFELQIIAAVVIGGTSLMGGRGSALSSVLGVLIIAVLNAGLASAGVKDETKRIITGIVIVAAVVLDQYRSRGLSLRPLPARNPAPAPPSPKPDLPER